MDVIFLILYIVAALCFLGAALVGRGADGAPRVIGWPALVSFGLLAWVLVPLINQARGM